MVDDRLLSGLTIEHTNEGFGNFTIPHTIPFELSTGQKGIIKTKVNTGETFLVDIKIQKYQVHP